jgi:hypothetical protein
MGRLLNSASTLMCPHGGTVSITTSNTKANGGGAFLVRNTDTFTIAGCPLNISGALHPCTTVRWVSTALQSRSDQSFNLTDESVGLCQAADQAVQGTVQVINTQTKVMGK